MAGSVAIFASACADHLVINSVPSGAQLYLNGTPAGTTPYDKMSPGSCRPLAVKLEKPGYHDSIATLSGDECRASKGRIVAAVFTLGILGVLNPPYYDREFTDVLIPSDDSLRMSQGTGGVYGQAFLKTVGGDVKYAAGSIVSVCPESIREQFVREATRAIREPDRTSVSGQYCRHMKADAEGHFEFDGLGPGNYFVATSITWQTPIEDGWISNGGIAYDSFILKDDGERARVIVNGVELPFDE
jgi:hypothetical protein